VVIEMQCNALGDCSQITTDVVLNVSEVSTNHLVFFFLTKCPEMLLTMHKKRDL
jgi:hypothetical protein